ncbi:hypothetical protein MtrunA17_Chr4g0052701 [Medicago truncatula]|uniref:Uncharacterized protein n=1 Tax=Medicago truncatula TaxID=3880 RepID=A0A396IBE9_MEDTR|nr:hypothetical protein MtrunA17_Chr4g0052701 [Medicago truncatula]
MCIMHHTGTIHRITATRQRNPNGSTSSYIISIWNLISSLDLLILNQTRKSNPGYCVQGITRYNLVTRLLAPRRSRKCFTPNKVAISFKVVEFVLV